MGEIGKVELPHPDHTPIFLFSRVQVDQATGIKIDGKMKMYLATLAKGKKVI
jgi:hypothetical protein